MKFTITDGDGDTIEVYRDEDGINIETDHGTAVCLDDNRVDELIHALQYGRPVAVKIASSFGRLDCPAITTVHNHQ